MSFCGRCGEEMNARDATCPLCDYGRDDEVIYHAEYSRQHLLDEGLSPGFVDFVLLDPKPEGFRFWCESRHGGWACYEPEGVSRVYPLWTTNGDVTALWVRDGQREFVKLYHDDPAHTFLARTEQGLLLHLFRSVIDSDCSQDPEQSFRGWQQLANVAGFDHLAELWEWQQRKISGSPAAEQFESFAASVDAR